MTKLIEKIRADQLAARKEKNTVVASLLSTLLGEVKQVADAAAEKEPRGLDNVVIKRDATDLEVLLVVKRFLDRNEELRNAVASTSTAYEEAMLEKNVLEAYRPKQMTSDEIKSVLESAIDAGTPKNMGALQKFLKEHHAGSYDGKLATAVVVSLI